MPQPRPSLVTAAQLAKILSLSRSRITGLLHVENCPHVKTADGVRFDLEIVVPWYMRRFGKTPPGTEPAHAPEDDHAEAMRRMVAVVHRAIAEHVEALTSDRGLTRFLEVLQALGLDERTRYLARRAVQLWLGTTLPGGEVALRMEDPSDGPPAQWERFWRATVGSLMARSAADRVETSP